MSRTAVVFGDIILDIRGSLNDEFAVAVSGDSAVDGHVSLALAGTGVGMARALSSHFDSVQLIGALGDDITSRLLDMLLHDESFETVIFRKGHVRAGTAIVLRDAHPGVSHGRRIVVVFRGANDAVTESDVLTTRASVEAAELVCVDGYGLLAEPRRTGTLRAMRLARAAGCQVFLDLVPHDLFRHWTLDRCRRLAADATVIGSSGTTLAHLLGLPWPDMRPLDRQTALQVAERVTDQLGPKVYLVHFGQGPLHRDDRLPDVAPLE